MRTPKFNRHDYNIQMNKKKEILKLEIEQYIDRKLQEPGASFDYTAPINRNWVSPSYLHQLVREGSNRNSIRNMVKKVPHLDIYESCRLGEISSVQGAELLMIRREPNSWLIRALLKLKR